MRAEKRCLSLATVGQFTSHPEWLVHCDSGRDVTVLEAVKSKIKALEGSGSVETCFLVCRWPSSLCVFTWPSYKDTSHWI